jgi:hypothetical protein
MLAFLQRALIYFPTREKAIRPEDSDWPTGQVHTVQLRTEDGLTLRGWHVLPDDVRAADAAACDEELRSDRPLVIYFSGNAGHRGFRGREVGMLTSLGVHVFLFDYRGYGDNAGKPTEESIASDAQAIWHYATNLRGVAPQRIILYGESLGGAVVARLAADLCAGGTPPAGLILRSTFSSLPDVGAYHYPILPVRLVLIDRYLAQQHVTRVSCPILQIHGRDDTIVPIQLARRLFDAAPDKSSRGVSKRFVEIPAADHNDIVDVAEEAMSAAIFDFLGEIAARDAAGHS